MSSRRVFANKNDLNFSEYNKIISGAQIYKNTPQRTYLTNSTIVQNLGYNALVNLQTSYSNCYVNQPPTNCETPPVSINDARNTCVNCANLVLGMNNYCDCSNVPLPPTNNCPDISFNIIVNLPDGSYNYSDGSGNGSGGTSSLNSSGSVTANAGAYS